MIHLLTILILPRVKKVNNLLSWNTSLSILSISLLFSQIFLKFVRFLKFLLVKVWTAHDSALKKVRPENTNERFSGSFVTFLLAWNRSPLVCWCFAKENLVAGFFVKKFMKHVIWLSLCDQTYVCIFSQKKSFAFTWTTKSADKIIKEFLKRCA